MWKRSKEEEEDVVAVERERAALVWRMVERDDDLRQRREISERDMACAAG